MNPDEQALIRSAQRGDSGALALLMQNHYAFLVKYLIKITMHPQLAEDLAQETMLKCIEKIGLYNGRSKFSSWLIAIATNLYMDDLRRKKRERNWQEEQQALRKLRWQVGQLSGEWSDALEAIGTLPRETRVPIILKHVYGYSYDEIAEMLDIPAGTVKSRVHNGLQHLRKEMSSDEETV